MAKKKKKKIRSHVKRLELQQKRRPMSPAKYKKKLRIARRKDFFRIFAKVIVMLCIVFLALFAVGNLLFYRSTGETLFSCMREAQEIVAASTEDDFKYAQTTYIYGDDGTKLTELSEDVDATYLSYEEIPVDVVNAFVAVEDRTFWTNGGIDYKGIARVCLNYIKTRGEVAEGASTITQQLARGAFLSNEKTMVRKVTEIFIARELTKKYSKEQIMEFYCNTCCFANGIYGVEDAAETYFGRSIDELTLSETAYICAIPNRPEYYNPLKESQNAVARRDKILEDMESCGFIKPEACSEAKTQAIRINEIEEEENFYNYEVTYAINCAVRYFMKLDGFEFQYSFRTDEEYDEYNALYDEAYSQAKHKLYTGGYEVYTTMNLEAQKELQDILDEQLLFSQDVDQNGIYELQGAMTVIDNETGKVVAMIGGRSQDEIAQTYSLNRGFQGYAQPGSSFKPLAVYAPALDNDYSASSTLTEVNVDIAKKSTSEKIASMSGSKLTLRYAVENSKNGCAYWLFNKITPKVGLSYVTDMNFSRIVPEDYTLSAALGGLTHGVSTVEMANAYSTLENHGEYTQTDCLYSILDSDGNEIYEEPESKTVYSKEAADEMTDIMKGVISKGTARGMNWSGSTQTQAAGKTGTTNDYMAGWFCGYTPYYTIAVWVGCDIPKTVNNLQGGTYPAYIWKAAMLYLIDDLPAAEFELEGTYSNSSGVRKKTTAVQEEEPEEDTEEDTEEDKEDTDTIDNTDHSDNTQVPATDIPADTTQEITGTGGSGTADNEASGDDSSAAPPDSTGGTTAEPSEGNNGEPSGTGEAETEGNGTDTSGTQ